jgi:hypothetical protein
MMKQYHEVRDVRFEGTSLHITIDGQARTFDLRKISSTLLNASENERRAFEISPSGYGIYWPLLDEDLSIDGLLGVLHMPLKKKAKTS